jgi:hypothetical protein
MGVGEGINGKERDGKLNLGALPCSVLNPIQLLDPFLLQATVPETSNLEQILVSPLKRR